MYFAEEKDEVSKLLATELIKKLKNKFTFGVSCLHGNKHVHCM